MKKLLLACDLDNTLLRSHRRRQEGDICVEWLEGREQSFLSAAACHLLRRAVRETFFAPITTRSVEQYRRIQWPEGCAPAMAAAVNGAVLIEDGVVNEAWREKSLGAVRPYQEELKRISLLLSGQGGFRVCRMVEETYLFASFENEAAAAARAEKYRGTTRLTVLSSGRKLYFFPPEINKGLAVLRLKEQLGAVRAASAGDSVIDLPMLNAAQLAIVPDESLVRHVTAPAVQVCGSGEDFARFILETALSF